MTTEISIRLYCPTHKTSFTISPEARPVCDVGGHALAEKFPPEEFWEYCCDCQTFRPSEITASGSAQGRCLVCDRQIVRRFLCEGCHVISVESDEASKRRKPYTLGDDGGIKPECPACGKTPRAAALFPHDCPEVEALFITARDACPFCSQKVKPEPASQPSHADARTISDAAAEQTPVGFCGKCGRGYGHDATFCGGCGLMLPTHPDYKPAVEEPIVSEDFPPYQPPPRPDPLPPPTPTDGGMPSLGKAFLALLLVIIGATVLVAVVVSVSTSNRNNTNYYASANANYYAETTDSKLKRAISQGNLVTPAGSSAYDYYQQLRREGGSLSSHNDTLLPLLKQKPKTLLDNLYEPGGDDGTFDDWEEGAKMLEWAAEMSPSDTWVKSRAVYCRGRVWYLTRGSDDAQRAKNSDEALRLWQQAADLDKSWPVPINGVGLIYNERKQYGTAEPYFRQALSRDSGWAVPYNNLGTAYRESNNKTAAYENYNKAVSLAPKWGRPHAWLGQMAEEEGDYSRAAEEYKAVLDLVPQGTPGWNLDRVRQKYEAARTKAGYY